MATYDIILRQTKGSTLTNNEVDANFSNLALYKLEADEAVSTNTPLKVVKRDASGNFVTNKTTFVTSIQLGQSNTYTNNYTLYPEVSDGTLRLAVSDNTGLQLTDIAIFNGTTKLTFPTTNGSANDVLVTDGSGNLSWSNSLLNINTTGNAGTVTNGLYSTNTYADPSWLTYLNYNKVLPSIIGNSGKYLKTDGSNISWTTVPIPEKAINLPLANAVSGAIGSSDKYASENHVHPVQQLTIGTGLSGTSYNGTAGVTISNTGVLSLSAGTTGLSVNSSTGAITLSGTLKTSNGGTGADLSAATDWSIPYVTTVSSVKKLTTLGIGQTGQFLSVVTVNNAPTLSWVTSSYTIGISIPNPLPASAQYPIFVGSTSGQVSGLNVASNFSYVPTTGVLSATSFTGAGTGLTGTALGLSIGGNASTSTTSTKWATPRTITLGGVLSGNVSIDGSTNVTLNTTVASGIVQTFSAGSTGFTPSSNTSGAITLSGTLNVVNGGTGTTSLTQWGVVYGASTTAMASTAAGTAGMFLRSNASSAPTWATPTINVSAATTGTYYPLFVAANGDISSANTKSTLSFDAASGTLSATSFTGAGTNLTGTAANLNVGGTSSKWATPRTITLGGVLSGNVSIDGSTNVTLTAAVASGIVTTFSTGTTGFTPSSDTSGAITLAGILKTNNGGTGVDLSTVNDWSIPYITTVSTVKKFVTLNNGTTGQFLKATTSGAPSWATPTINVSAATTGTYYPLFVAANGDISSVNTKSTLSFDAASGTLSATSFTGAGTNLTGTAANLTTGNATKWATSRTITLSGAVTSNAISIDGSANITIPTTYSTIILGTNTSGNYLGGLTAGTGILISGDGGVAKPNWIPTIAVDSSSSNTASKIVIRDDSGNFAASNITLSGSLSVGLGGIIFPAGIGDTATISLTKVSDATTMVFTVGNEAEDTFNFVNAQTQNLLKVNGNVVWHSGNDGTGTGLDADTVDGKHVCADDTNVTDGALVRTSASGNKVTINNLQTISTGTASTPAFIWGATTGSGMNQIKSFATSSFVAPYWGASGNTFSTYIDQYIKTTDRPQFGGGYASTFAAGNGSYNLKVACDSTAASAATILFFAGIGSGSVVRTKFGLNSSNEFQWGGLDWAGQKMKLNNAGDLTIQGAFLAVGDITALSDRSVKTNIELIENALDKVSELSGYTFDRTDIKTHRQTGVIAQEVEQVLPEAVTEIDGLKNVNYGSMVGLLIQAIKEQQEQIQQLTDQVKSLSIRISGMEN